MARSHRVSLSVLALGLCAWVASGATALAQCTVTVDASSVVGPVSPLFFGTNALFWIEDDAARADGKIAAALREMPCRLLRFPGGTAAENYHWKTGRLQNLQRFPSKDGPATMGFEEFMRFCGEVGAEPILVVNLETSFVAGDVDAGVREAVEWVEYCKAKGYRVRYWEIGNEQYLLTHMTARQYAESFGRFARAMKAADPTLKIGAVGPSDLENVGRADRVCPEDLKRIQAMPEAQRKAAVVTLGRDYQGDPWWPTVLRVAGVQMDLAVIHDYFPARFGRPLALDAKVARLRDGIRRLLPGRELPIALTEWNVARTAEPRPAAQALLVAEAIGQFLSGGVDLACFWPLRFGGAQWGSRSLLQLETKAPHPSYAVMKLFATHLGARLVKATASGAPLYACASISADGKELSVFLVNRDAGEGDTDARITLAGFAPAGGKASALTAARLDAAELSSQAPAVARDGGSWRCRLPARSLTLLTFAR